jgi:hypothetical protein
MTSRDAQPPCARGDLQARLERVEAAHESRGRRELRL